MRIVALLCALALSACVTVTIRHDSDMLADMRALEAARGAAIRADDETALSRIYAADFTGVTASGAQVTRDQLFAVFARTHGNAALFEGSTSEVLSARREGDVVVVVGRLHFGGADSMYTHVFRWRGDHWELFAAAASPITR